MEFRTLIALIMFCGGAAFTMVDIGTDVALAYEYWNDSHFVRGRMNVTNYTTLSNGMAEYEYWNGSDLVSGWLNETQIPNGWGWLQTKLTSNGMDPRANSGFAIGTTVWIALGGLIQFILATRLLCKNEAHLNLLPKSIQILLLLCSPILLGPVVVNIYGAVFIIQNAGDVGIGNHIQRFVRILYVREARHTK